MNTVAASMNARGKLYSASCGNHVEKSRARRCRKIKALAFALLAGCGSDASTAANATPVGAYSLASVNGQNLPYVSAQTVVGSVSTTTLFMSMTLTIANGGLWSEKRVFRTTETRPGTQTVFADSTADLGSWQIAGDVIALNRQNGSRAYTGTTSGTRMELSDGARNYVFNR